MIIADFRKPVRRRNLGDEGTNGQPENTSFLQRESIISCLFEDRERCGLRASKRPLRTF